MQRKTSNALPILIILLLVGVIAYAVSTQLSIDNTGTIEAAFTAYNLPEAGTLIDTIVWGIVAPSGIYEETIYIESTLTEPVTLNITYLGFEDFTDAGFTITHSETLLISPTERLPLIFTLTVPQNTGEIVDIAFQTVIDVEVPS